MKKFRILLIAFMAMLISAPAFASAGSLELNTAVELNDTFKPEGKKPKKKKNKTKAKKAKADKAKGDSMKKGKKAPKEEVDQ